MKRKTGKPLTDAELKVKAINRWENEGGALNPPPSPAAGGKKDPTGPATARPALPDPPETIPDTGLEARHRLRKAWSVIGAFAVIQSCADRS